ncbi:hypothetical protein Vadar_020653 [Vaccinium darrowii]|uniref:Uncharacterized protein n=1 Tax=Vaccinium darrowii TaxID=229202 RepID=A0ACB7ZLT1_9ERIC|nr:hypothetical protein Vadar_020653 [Vaccinium darrowii]
MEGRSSSGSNANHIQYWFRSNGRFLLPLLLIAFWTCAAFYFQYYYRSSPKGVDEAFLGHGRIRKPHDHGKSSEFRENNLIREYYLKSSKNSSDGVIGEWGRNSTTYGLIVGPFGATEDRILEKRPTGSCDRNGEFARIVRSRKFVLVFHELTMTGAPLSMMELATELLSCEATVSVVVLKRKGGLMPELLRRKINVVADKSIGSFKTAVEADLVIAGSAVCASWIEKYKAYFPGGSSQNIAWWIMENRKEYFEKSKHVLNRVKMLIFLTESQSKQWLTWCAEENINLHSQEISVVPLSVNDELAFVAGISGYSSGPEVMLQKRKVLRNAVREEMGLKDSDMVVMSLSSINGAKGQLLVLESAQMVVEKELSSEGNIRQVVPKSGGAVQEQTLKVVIGSVGSKSNKLVYVEAMLSFVNQHPSLSRFLLWTPTTTRVAALYSAADVYVINSQGIGETFGRVTIEAMAFGLPVLGTDAGGTKDIVEHNKTGLLHPLGQPGVQVLSENLQFLLKNPSARQEMGTRGREKVEKMYLKRHMYKKFAGILSRCMTLNLSI